MRREPERLDRGPFDALVIGGGIYGSWIACHAARAGLKTALVEKEDWGSGTSSASSKLLHGGLRYLEYYDFGLVRKSLGERRELHRRLPHHVRPLHFLLPVYAEARVGRVRLELGLWLYDRLAGGNQPVGPHRAYSARALSAAEPRLRSQGLRGGFRYGDCWTDDARMVLEIVETAMAAGAAAVNYTKVEAMLREGGRVVGARVRDMESGALRDLRAAAVINAAGAWAEALVDPQKPPVLARHTKGVHLVLPGLPSGDAVLLTAKADGRVFFLIPWYGRTLLGTTDTDYGGTPDAARVEAADVDYLLDAAADYVTPAWTREEVIGAFCGLRTLRKEEGKPASEVTREWSLEQPLPGLWMPVGGKYTSARVESMQVVSAVRESLGRGRGVPPGEDAPMAWFPGEPFGTWKAAAIRSGCEAGMDEETAACCADRHGARFAAVLEKVRADRSLARRLVPDLPFSRVEVVHAVQEEMARTLADVLRRRIPLLLLSDTPRAAVEDAAQLAGAVLEWSRERRALEVEQVLAMKQAQDPEGGPGA